MFLKMLELQGFKSFPDKTTLRFDKGVTAVIGPNGSGKSNISDAMKWVLGEVSSKNLRGGSMEDVIFSGSSTRKPMGFAEVSVTFGQFPATDSPFSAENGEIKITRRYYRVGESEYMINQKPCKLMDLHELFLNTGVGREGYSIVGQGKIADIVSQKNESRRNILEEAAGISKYRYRKKEAQRKLVSVEENLVRVRDIAAELSTRVEPLENEARKAKNYLSLYESKKSIDIGLYLYDVQKNLDLSESLKQDLQSAKMIYETSAERLEALEQKNEEIFAAAQENKKNSGELQEHIQSLSEEKIAAEGAVSLLNNEIEHAKERKSLLSEDIAAIQADLAGREADYALAMENLAKAQADCVTLQSENDALEQNILAVRAQSVQFGNSKHAAAEQLSKVEFDLNEARIALSVMENAAALQKDKRKELLGQREELNEQQSTLLSRRAEMLASLAEYRDKKEKIISDISIWKTELEKLEQEKQKIASVVSEARITLGAQKGKADQLNRMNELFEGYSRSVKYLMNESKKGNVQKRNGEPCTIYGPISKLIHVQQNYALAIETALGANIQNIVLESEQDAKAAIEFLKVNRAGRATFYPVQTCKAQYRAANTDDFVNMPGFIGIASNLISVDSKFRIIIDSLLSRTVVTDTIDSAAEMARKSDYRLRFVTLDGQIINAGGSFTGGSSRQESGVLSRSAEIEKLRAFCADLERQIDEQSAKEQKLAQTSETFQGKLRDANATVTMLDALQSEQNTSLSVLDAKLESIGKTLEGIDAEEQKSGESGQKYTAEHEMQQQRIDSLSKKLIELRECIDVNTRRASDMDKQVNDLRMQQTKKQITFAEKKKDCEAAEARCALCTEEIEKLKGKTHKAETEISLCQEKISLSQNQISEKTADISKLDLEIVRCRQTQKRQSEDELEFDKKLAELREQIRNESQQKELLSRNVLTIENKYQSVLNEQDKQTAAVWDAYELTYSAAKAAEHIDVDEKNRAEFVSQQEKLKSKIRSLGNVNMNAIEEYEEVSSRYTFLSAQISDLESSQKDLNTIIVQLESEMRKQFADAFEKINENFSKIFTELFGGGKAELILTDPERILDCDIEIAVAPPGKIVKNMSLLSGGEQAFCAIALYFAILKISPTPFCIFDEIEAALDDVNVDRFADYIKQYSENTQIIIITHRRGTMETAERLYGVTMAKKGISNVFELDASRVSDEYNVTK